MQNNEYIRIYHLEKNAKSTKYVILRMCDRWGQPMSMTSDNLSELRDGVHCAVIADNVLT